MGFVNGSSVSRVLPVVSAWLAVWAGPVSGAEGTSPRLVALVAGRPVTVRDLSNRLRLSGVTPSTAQSPDWSGALQAAVDRALLLEAASREKISVSDTEVRNAVKSRRRGPAAKAYEREIRLLGLSPLQERRRMRERLLIQRLLVAKLGTKLYVPPGAVVEWYKKNKDLLAGPEVRTARVITVRFKETGAGDEAVAAARRKINRLRQEALGGGDFAKLAKRHSEDPWAPRGGLLGPIRDGDEASVFAAPLFKLGKPGDVSGVFRTKNGFHVLRLETITPGAVPTFDQAQGVIRERLSRGRQARYAGELAQELRRKTVVRIFWQHLPCPQK